MFKKFKLICTAIGLVAVLVMGLAMPGVTQQGGLTRQNILNTVQAAMGHQLTATTREQLALDAAVFFSNEEGSTWAFVPAAFRRSLEVHEYYLKSIEDLRAGKEVELLLGGFYIAERTPKGLNPGFYLVKTVNQYRANLIDNDGEIVADLPIGFQEPFPPSQTAVILSSRLNELTPDGGGGAGGAPPPQPPWKNLIPGQICFSIPVIPGFAEWELGCVDP